MIERGKCSIVNRNHWSLIMNAIQYYLNNIFSVSNNTNFTATPQFGANEWQTSFNHTVSNAPSVPNHLSQMLTNPCPFWNGKQINETHFLCLIPGNMDVVALGKILRNSPNGPNLVNKYLKSTKNPYWVLLTKQPIPNSRHENVQTQKNLLSQNFYAMPTTLEAAIGIVAAKKMDLTLFDGMGGATRTEEKIEGWPVAVGYDSATGYSLITNDWNEMNGVAGVLR